MGVNREWELLSPMAEDHDKFTNDLCLWLWSINLKANAGK